MANGHVWSNTSVDLCSWPQLLDKCFNGKCQLSASYASVICAGCKVIELIRVKSSWLVSLNALICRCEGLESIFKSMGRSL
jgi:hypothetical protein